MRIATLQRRRRLRVGGGEACVETRASDLNVRPAGPWNPLNSMSVELATVKMELEDMVNFASLESSVAKVEKKFQSQTHANDLVIAKLKSDLESCSTKVDESQMTLSPAVKVAFEKFGVCVDSRLGQNEAKMRVWESRMCLVDEQLTLLRAMALGKDRES